MTKDEAKKIIECAVDIMGKCDKCPARKSCDGRQCEQHVHSAAKALYGGNETNEVAKLAKKLMLERVKSTGNIAQHEIDNIFTLAYYFFEKASKTNE